METLRFIGNNTAGKTTLLKALQVGLGAYLQSLKTLPGGTSYRRNFSSLDKFMRFDQELRDYVPNTEKPRITIHADFPITTSWMGIVLKCHLYPSVGTGNMQAITPHIHAFRQVN